MFSNVINKIFPGAIKSKEEINYPFFEGGILIVSGKEYDITLEKDDDGVEYYTTVINKQRFKFKARPHLGKEYLESLGFDLDLSDEKLENICVGAVKKELQAEIFLEENPLFKEYKNIFG